MQPGITVLMSVRDGDRWLVPAIKSVLAQSRGDFEFIIVDDGSIDGTPNILDQFAQQDARVRLIRLPRVGLVQALNRGLREAQAPLIARMDADDLCAPDRLARQAEEMEVRPDLALLGSWAHVIDAEGNTCGQLQPQTSHDVLVASLQLRNPFVHSSIMMRTHLVREIGGYRSAFEGAEDYDLWLRLSEQAQIGNLPEYLLSYRRHDDNLTRRKAVRQVFSVRLAQHGARFRRSGQADLTHRLTNPPDFRSRSSDAEFFGEDARICRFLALADLEDFNPSMITASDIREFSRLLPQLTHAERKLAGLAVRNLFPHRQRLALSGVALLLLLIRLHPARAIKLLSNLARNDVSASLQRP